MPACKVTAPMWHLSHCAQRSDLNEGEKVYGAMTLVR